MNTLIAQDIEVSFGDRRILRGCDLKVASGDKVGVVGANGSGKSTLLKVLTGELGPDHGQVHLQGRMGVLHQEPVLVGETVGACAAGATAWHGALVDAYQQALADGEMATASTLQDRLDTVGWEVGHRVDAMLDRLGAPPPEAQIAHLSGGERRRVALALALLGQPDLLVLDEPTNHLDTEAVEWLQAWLTGFRGALLLVTHDRYLLEAVADRIVEIEQGRTVAYEGSYADYLLARAERQAALQKAEDRRLAMIAREAAWASRSPAARSTKQKARLQRLEALQAQESVVLDRHFEMDLRTGARHGDVLVQLTGVRKRYGGPELLGGLDLALAPGERLGILGPNGAGKSTLLRVLSGAEVPDKGERITASRVEIAVLDQGRSGLEAPDGSDWTVFEAAGGGNSHVQIAGRAAASWQRGGGGKAAQSVHVAGFLERFMFPREALDQRVSALSGGERARLLLAKLLLRGAGVLLLDEPTNDLDLLTLRVLEEALLGYDGAAVVVTHDRAFLDRVCTAVLAFEPLEPHEKPRSRPPVQRYATRAQYLRALEQRRRAHQAAAEEAARKAGPVAAPAPRPAMKKKGLSYKERRELDALPGRVEALEAEQGALAMQLADSATYSLPPAELAALQARAAALPGEIEGLFDRWSALEERAG